MIVISFRSRIRPGCDLQALDRLGTRMYDLASTMPGFVSYQDFTAADGETLTLIEFADRASLAAWRDHPEHRAAQERARLEFFSDYRIQVCEAVRSYRFSAAGGRVEES
jgi:heme-degrading monooxygenase HmoA